MPLVGEEIWSGINLLRGLPFFLRHPISKDQAQIILRRRLEERPARLINLIRRVATSPSWNPYSRILGWAGFELGDIEKLVSQEGVEAALRILYRNGVYVTAEEFKGRRPILRGSLRLVAEPRHFQMNPRSSSLFMQTSGSRGSGTPVPINLDYLRSRAIDSYLNLKACGGVHWAHGIWAVPGSSALAYLLELAGFGARPVRWFSQVDLSSPNFHSRYRRSAQAIRWTSRMAGSSLPEPVYASVDNPEPVLGWMKQALEFGQIPHLFTYTSSGLRLSEAAQRDGANLTGARITVTGEPVTELRLTNIRRCGATVATRYGAAESGTIGYGCLEPENPDEVHLLSDRLALIQKEEEGEKEGLPRGAFFVTTLESSSPFFLLNLSLGDRGVVADRNCGCPLNKLGWKTSLHSIVSFEKITSEGMTFLKADATRIIDEVLPALFGGSPTHYQLLEGDDERGRPYLKLLVHPDVGPVDDQALAGTFLDAMGRGRGVEKIMSRVWNEAKLLRVERRPPLLTASGKMQPVYSQSQSLGVNR